MKFIRFLIVIKNSINAIHDKEIKTYEGMNRYQLGNFTDIPDELLYRGLSLEDMLPEKAEMSYRLLLRDMLAMNVTQYELLMLGDNPSEDWEFLGYDVGETTKAAWSAIANRDVFLNHEEIAKWEESLNSHGIFEERADAEAFLAVYLDSEEPDKGWTGDGWTETPDWYAVVPIYRLNL